MKIEDLARPGLLALGVAGLAATALIGFAAGMAVSRDPEALRRTARRVAREAARGIERATLLASQASEHIGDLWAEVREEALAEVDAADFARAEAGSARTPRATGGAAAGAGAAAAVRKTKAKLPRKTANRPRKARAPVTDAAAGDAAGTA